MGWVWRCSPWKGQHAKFLVHLAVADVVNDVHENELWMSQSTLAEKAGVCRQTVCEWLAEAVEAGLLVVVQDNSRAGRPNCYRFIMEGGVGSGDRGCRSSRQGGVGSADTNSREELKRTQTSTSLAKQNAPEDSDSVIAKRVVDAWVAATGRDANRVKVNAKRVAAVKARLREGYTEADLIAAVRGVALSAWHMGDNPSRKRYDDLLIVIRDGERVEKFRDLFEQGGDMPSGAVDQVMSMLQQGSRGMLELGS